ncbi:MAG: hypothetical protein A2297_02615, partial [Elusimicrobia bacterium RIFOXYB2_FULL_48_7]
QLEQKKGEKLRYEKKEQSIKKELNRINKEMNKVSSEINSIQSKIRLTQRKLKSTENEMAAAKIEISQWKIVLMNELGSLYRNNYTLRPVISDPWEERLRADALKIKTTQINQASARETYAQAVYLKYISTQDELSQLNSQLVDKKAEQEKVRAEKGEVLKTTQGSRVAAEEEINKLNESTAEMKFFIESLEKKKNETAELKKKEELAKRTFQEKKKMFAWPLQGIVTARFGKNKHPQLNTYVISNGIKIQGAQSASGDSVTAIDKGEVVYAKGFRSYGNTVIIDHGGGVYTIYGQLGEILIDIDTKVKAGDVVGKTGPANNNTLYFEVSINGQPQDPLEWLGAAAQNLQKQ